MEAPGRHPGGPESDQQPQNADAARLRLDSLGSDLRQRRRRELWRPRPCPAHAPLPSHPYLLCVGCRPLPFPVSFVPFCVLSFCSIVLSALVWSFAFSRVQASA